MDERRRAKTPGVSKMPAPIRGGGTALTTKETLMGKLTVTSFITLDNVVEDPHLWSGAYQSDDTGELNGDVLRASDALLLGRVTYEGFAAAWPSRSGDPFSDKFNAMPKYVVSTTLERADWNNSTIVSEDPMDRVRALKEDNNLLVWGSPSLVQSLMDAGLVDELVLLYSPIVRGKGIRLFRDAGEQHDLRITDSTVLGGGMLALRMTPAA
jgi:dihydrofolate reductase